MARAHFRDYVFDNNGNVIVSASVEVQDPATGNAITETMYSASSGATTVDNPLTSDANGMVEFYLAQPKRVQLAVSKTGYPSGTTLANVINADALRDLAINVKDPTYGAVGDGVTDDTAAIQAVIDSFGEDGGTMFCPRGLYKITSSLTVPSNVRLEIAEGAVLWRTAGTLTIASRQPINVRWFGASGYGLRPSGSITINTTSLTVDDATGIYPGNHVTVIGAGAAGANLSTCITAVNGTVLTLADAASTTVASVYAYIDDTTPIQEAINAHNSLSKQRTQIYLPRGEYYTRGSITINNAGNYLQGDGRTASSLVAFVADQNIIVLGADCTHVGIRDLYMLASGTGRCVYRDPDNGPFIDSVIESCWFYGGAAGTLVEAYFVNTSFNDCIFEGAAIGLKLAGVAYVNVDNCIFYNQRQGAIVSVTGGVGTYGLNLSNLLIEAYSVNSGAKAAIDLTSFSNVMMTNINCHLAAGGTTFYLGVRLTSCDNVSINGLVMEDFIRAGASTTNLYLNACTDVVVNGLILDNATLPESAVWINSTSNFQVNGIVVGADEKLLRVEGTSSYGTITVEGRTSNNYGVSVEDTATKIKLLGGSFRDCGKVTQTSAVVSMASSGRLTIAGTIIESGGASNSDYCLNASAGTTRLEQVEFVTGDSGFVTAAGTVNAYACIGYITENKGTATVASGNTTIAVNHGLSVTPALTDIQVTPTLLSNAAKFWITTPTSTQFTISTDQDPGAGTATFVWQAQVL